MYIVLDLGVFIDGQHEIDLLIEGFFGLFLGQTQIKYVHVF